ncbi:MAG: hypothetical protein M1836_005919 [Candelina mexicana]|nr:MAG: hypothetical protein M1836_005919 [Candelina mexicana]
MAPDRGAQDLPTEPVTRHHSITNKRDATASCQGTSNDAIQEGDSPVDSAVLRRRRRSDARKYLAEHAEGGQNFTVRGIFVGSAIGIIICFSNMYFGLQTGWISGMTMPSALIGFAFFKSIARYIDYPFTPVENVLVQTVAGAVGTMPLGCGFVGVLPALNFMLKPEENGPLALGLGKLVVWAVGICFFGVIFAVPLRKEFIIREKLRFPSGTATALMIGVLHGNTTDVRLSGQESGIDTSGTSSRAGRGSAATVGPGGVAGDGGQDGPPSETYPETSEPNEYGLGLDRTSDWKAKIRLLVISFAVSAVYVMFMFILPSEMTVAAYFIPQVRKVPIFGFPLAQKWLWTLNPSPAYVGQGIIMGAIIGWAILSPLAKSKGWAPGPVSDWTTGSKGWIVWVSLSIMLVDSIVSLGWLTTRPLVNYGSHYVGDLRERARKNGWQDILAHPQSKKGDSHVDESTTLLSTSLDARQSHHTIRHTSRRSSSQAIAEDKELPDVDAPPEHLVSNRVVVIGLFLSIIVCIAAIHITFGNLVPLYANILAVFIAIVLSAMGVRALGETDLNPVSGISKLTQLFFALVVPSSNPNAVIINLLAGAVSESGSVQAGDMLQDLKTGHLLGAAPKAQFYGQMIGSFVGAIVSAVVYKLYTNVYKVPGDLFQVPTGFVWLFAARLVTGKGLPEMAGQFALGAGVIFAVGTALRVSGHDKGWQCWIPSGIAVAVGKISSSPSIYRFVW